MFCSILLLIFPLFLSFSVFLSGSDFSGLEKLRASDESNNRSLLALNWLVDTRLGSNGSEEL